MKAIINTLTVVVLAAIVFSCVLTLLASIEPSLSDAYLYWNFWLLKQFRFQYWVIQLLGLVLVITSYALKRLPRKQTILAFILLTLFCSFNACELLPYYWPQEQKHHTKDSFKLLLSNLGPTIDFRPFLAYIQQEKPDIICIVENDAKLDTLFQTAHLKKIYPYQVPIQHQLGLYSKLPIQSHQFEHAKQLLVPSLNAMIKTPESSFLLVVSHPAVPLTPETLQQQQKQYHFWQQRFAHYPHPLMIASDMNSTPWTLEFKKLLTETGLKDSQTGFGIQPSWGVESFLFQVPIDHVLISKQFRVIDRKIGPNIGSDHRPVLVTLSINDTHEFLLKK